MNRTGWMLPLLATLFSSTADAQIQRARFPVVIEVMTQPTVQQNVMMRRWQPIFEQLGQTVNFRSGRNGERVSLLETNNSGGKGVRVIGLLNADGTIRFPGKTFSMNSPRTVADWLARLKQYGARGPVNEDLTWGLGTEDFKQILVLLKAPAGESVATESVTAAIESLNLQSDFRIQFTAKARVLAAGQASQIADLTPDCSRLSKGSALAVVLAQSGLGFRPKKGSGGRFLLEVDVGDEGDNLYPIGWKNEAPITIAVKNLVKRFDISLEDQNANLVIQLLAKKLELPFAYASRELVEANKNPDDLKYSRKSGKTSAYRLIESIEARFDLGISFRTDEAGQLFLWVTTKENEKAFDQRFAHVKPKLPE
ncbi:MAG: hypothetical protein ABJZ55_01590 [Fuerstiella sp.]